MRAENKASELNAYLMVTISVDRRPFVKVTENRTFHRAAEDHPRSTDSREYLTENIDDEGVSYKNGFVSSLFKSMC